MRQLSIGLSAYRLFPGRLDQPAFVGATERIATAAARALELGPIDAEIRGEGFHIEEGPLDRDEAIARLARVCYERRAERLRVRAVPDPRDLAALYDALVRSPDELAAMGGVAAVLRAAGVAAVALLEVEPEAGEVDGVAVPSANLQDLESWDWVRDSIGLSQDPTDGRRALAEMAESLFARFQSVVASLPPEMAANVDLYRMLQDTVASLPDDQRKILNAVLIDRARADPLAEAYVGTMSDADLARVLVDMSAAVGKDPVNLAQKLVQAGVRAAEIVDLTAAVVAGRTDAGTILTEAAVGNGRPVAGDQSDEDDRLMFETVSDLLGTSLAAREHDDLAAIRRQFPDTEDALQAEAAAALGDYLRLEPDMERLERFLMGWVEASRECLRRGDGRTLMRLIDVADGGRAASAQAGRPDRAQLFDVYRRQIPDPATLRELVGHAVEGGNHLAVQALLAPLGDAAVDGLLDVLAAEADGRARGILVNLLTELARGHTARVAARLSDRRWEVVRDAVAILNRAGGPEAAPAIVEASRHREPAVRKESIWGLIAVAGPAGAERLRHLADDPDDGIRVLAVGALGGLVTPAAVTALVEIAGLGHDQAIRRAALDHLARHPSADARRSLESLARSRHRPKLPRALRKHAKTLLRRGVGAAA